MTGTVYFNIIKDIEKIFGDKILLVSSDENVLESYFDEVEFSETKAGKLLTKETSCVYTLNDDSDTDMKSLKQTLIKDGLIFSKELKLYEDSEELDSEKEYLESVEGLRFMTIEELEEELEKDEEGLEEKLKAPSTPVEELAKGTKLDIKDWGDLTTTKIIFSFLKNYENIYNSAKKPLNIQLFSRDVKFENNSLFEILKKDGLFNQDIVDKLGVRFPLTGTKGKFKTPIDAAIFLNPELLNSSDINTSANHEYSKNIELYDNVFLYWMSLFAMETKNGAKALLKGTMNNIKKDFGDTEIVKLFDFEIVDIPEDILSSSLSSKIVSKTKKSKTIISQKIEDITFASAEYIFGIYNNCEFESVGKLRLKTKETNFIVIENKEDFLKTKDINEGTFVHPDILNALKIRGIDVSTSPNFLVPNHFIHTLENINLLLSGIPNLEFSEELHNDINKE